MTLKYLLLLLPLTQAFDGRAFVRASMTPQPLPAIPASQHMTNGLVYDVKNELIDADPTMKQPPLSTTERDAAVEKIKYLRVKMAHAQTATDLTEAKEISERIKRFNTRLSIS